MKILSLEEDLRQKKNYPKKCGKQKPAKLRSPYFLRSKNNEKKHAFLGKAKFFFVKYGRNSTLWWSNFGPKRHLVLKFQTKNAILQGNFEKSGKKIFP